MLGNIRAFKLSNGNDRACGVNDGTGHSDTASYENTKRCDTDNYWDGTHSISNGAGNCA